MGCQRELYLDETFVIAMYRELKRLLQRKRAMDRKGISLSKGEGEFIQVLEEAIPNFCSRPKCEPPSEEKVAEDLVLAFRGGLQSLLQKVNNND